ncbi:MAG TPA: YfhO family protein [Gammaproteobacteria bacterium]|nr:YfhO family protein [Gammaproteobacteria bacterium]
MNYLKSHKNEITIFFVFLFAPWFLCYDPFTMIMGDNWRAAFPAYQLTIEKIFSGSSLLWNEYILGGHPFLAEIVNGVLYPPRWVIYAILPVKWAYTVTILLHFSMTGWFTWLYLRSIHISKLTAFWGGMILMLSPIYRIQILDSISLLHTITWFPLILYFMEKRIVSGEKKFLLLAASAFVVQILAGFTQDSFYTAMAVVIYTALRYCNQHEQITLCVKDFIYDMFFFGLIVFSFSAIQLLPTEELLSVTQHYQLSWNLIEQFSAPPMGFLTFINPFVWGGFKEGVGIQTHYYLATFTSNNYSGIVTLLFAIYALKFWKNNLIKIWSFLLALSLVIALGVHVMPVAKLLFNFPLTHEFRFHTRIYFISSMAMVVLFSYGLDQILKLDKKSMCKQINTILKYGVVLEALVFVFICRLIIKINSFKDIPDTISYLNYYDLSQYYQFSNMALFGPFIIFSGIAVLLWFLPRVKQKLPVLIALMVVTFFELWAISSGFLTESEIVSPYKNALLKVKSLLQPTDRMMLIHYTGMQDASAMLYQMQSLNGFVAFDERSIASIRPGISSLADISDPSFFLDQIKNHPDFLSMLGLKYFIIDHFYRDDVEKMGRYKQIFSSGDYTVYENPSVKFRVYSVKDVREENKISYRDVDFNSMAVLNHVPADVREVGAAAIRKLIYKSGDVNVSVNCPADKCLVILSESFFPGWKALVDGKKSYLYKVNDLIMGTFVDKGEHWVRFYYLPRSVIVGICLFMFGLIWVPLWMIWPRKHVHEK